MTYQQILDRDVALMVAESKRLASAGLVGNTVIYYRREELTGMSDVLTSELVDVDGWKPTGVIIPCNVPWSAWNNYLRHRLGNVPLFA
jgi:hypothetical protein